MKFKEFCELALSNDIIGIVDDVARDEPKEVRAAFRWLLDNAPELEKRVSRFTYGRTHINGYNRIILYVSLEENK